MRTTYDVDGGGVSKKRASSSGEMHPSKYFDLGPFLLDLRRPRAAPPTTAGRSFFPASGQARPGECRPRPAWRGVALAAAGGHLRDGKQ